VDEPDRTRTAGFDDGGPEIPGGILGPVERVLVVGAGITGLTVANALALAGVDCVVLEARSRIGGRLYTADLAGYPVDLGGSWIHHPIGNPVGDFARLAGIECRPGNPLRVVAFDCTSGRWLSAEDIDSSMTVPQQGYHDGLGDLRTRLGPTSSAAAGIETYLATTGLSGDVLRRARQALRASVEADAAGAAEDQSLEWLWTQQEYDGDSSATWREAGWSHLVLFPPDPTEPALWVFDLDAFSGVPILACHTLHSATDHLGKASTDTAARWLLGMIGAALGRPCPEPVAVAVTGWADDPYAAGSYTHVPPGATNAHLDLLGTPVAGRVLFAGEHTQSARVGYSDGAMTSGIREAKRLLGTPTVRLAPR
jgi:monoamine oxidase